MNSARDPDVENFLEQSSLGTRGARQMRSRVTDAELATLHARLPGVPVGEYAPSGDRAEDSPLEVDFMTVAEVAAVMGISKMTVYRLVHSGALPAIRVGRSFRVPEGAVQDYLKETRSETAPT